MDWQTSEDTVAARPVTDADARALVGKPPASGAWREGDPVAGRRFVAVGGLRTESGANLPAVRIAYETWGTPNARRDNGVLVLHALTGDAHLTGPPAPGQPTAGWWEGIVGPGLAIDSDRWFVVAPNILGGCQGSTGPSSLAPDSTEWGGRFPYLTIRDQVEAQIRLADHLDIGTWAAVIGGSMGGMHALEWAIAQPERVARRRAPTRSPSTRCRRRRCAPIPGSAAGITTARSTATAHTAASPSPGGWRCSTTAVRTS